MDYYLLTGATGLLGRYLLWEFAKRKQNLAVVVRSSRSASARQRIEDLMQFWEKKAGYALQRPVVLEGELNKPCLGLDDGQIEWVRTHCREAVHNAASLTFVAESPGGEPYPSNIEGTKNTLELCRQAGITTFHQVSTAYVCGNRTGTILESELDEGQDFRNDYERSKFEGEQLVRNADFIRSLTIHRPGIIIGDSHTGYTSTYHGFYVPLTAAYGIAGQLQLDESFDPVELVRLFGMKGHEKKNFVPVDWVARIMGHVIMDERYHGRVYHLTPRKRTSLRDMVKVILKAFIDRPPQKTKPIDLSQFEKRMREQMAVYSTYWDQDPEFDQTNTVEAFPDLPCPDVDDACLKRTCDFAIEANFGWPREPSVIPDFDVESWLSPNSWSVEGGSGIGLSVTGPGGGEWTIQPLSNRIEEHRTAEPPEVLPGISPRCRARVLTNSSSLQKLVEGSLDLNRAASIGRIGVELDSQGSCEEILSLFEQFLIGKGTLIAKEH